MTLVEHLRTAPRYHLSMPPWLDNWCRIQLLVRCLLQGGFDATTWPDAKAVLRQAIRVRELDAVGFVAD